ncbi:hypothetical protein F2Q69_00013744 [Brassica cretica]|uniref:Uncharacterized protein n=1 Tax=Brassica cretica TaxID=69181 RepID=A0A8S9QFY8_BRACR|nr:hypothetical protein F2Q69_00013744 [Brassica cretica]
MDPPSPKAVEKEGKGMTEAGVEEAVKRVSVGNGSSIGGDGASAISKSGEASLGLETSAIVDLQISGGRAISLSPEVGPEGVALVAEAGKTKDSDVGIRREAVSELLNELEQLPVNALLAENAGKNGRELSLFLNNLSSGVESEKWVTLGEQGSNRSSPPWEQVLLDKVASPNSFQALQGIREEGEIDEDDGIEDELNLKTQDKRYEKG